MLCSVGGIQGRSVGRGADGGHEGLYAFKFCRLRLNACLASGLRVCVRARAFVCIRCLCGVRVNRCGLPVSERSCVRVNVFV